MSSHKNSSETIQFDYLYRLQDGREKSFSLTLDKATLQLQSENTEPLPDWTDLTYHQCPNCPLKPTESPRCPVATNFAPVMDAFKGDISYEMVEVEVKTHLRTYAAKVPLQKAISSLMGIYMVTSGCPILDKLKPMVRHHLPFADGEETHYRILSMYLLAQYFKYKKGLIPDWDLKDLQKIYEEIRVVNKSFSQRLASLAAQDAVPNAVVILSTLADSMIFAIDHDFLSKIEKLFEAYLLPLRGT